VIAGTYSTRGPARHHYDLGLSYATQRYDGGNPAALRDVTDGSRNAGALYGFDTWTVSPAFTVTYGTRYARYDYLENKGLLSPRVSMTLAAGDHFRVNTSASRRSIAPGAEEFLPPRPGSGCRRKSILSVANGAAEAEHTTHSRSRSSGTPGRCRLSASRVPAVRRRSVTMFGMDVPPAPSNSGTTISNGGDVMPVASRPARRAPAASAVGTDDQRPVEGQRGPSYWVLRLPSPS
jgi:hypothetical protein